MSYNKYPSVTIETSEKCLLGWTKLSLLLKNEIKDKSHSIIVIECYQGVYLSNIERWLKRDFSEAKSIHISKAYKDEKEIYELTQNKITDDRIFGYMTDLTMYEFMDQSKISEVACEVKNYDGLVFIFGTGASLVPVNSDLTLYADMSRWEIQKRMRINHVNNIGLNNKEDSIETKYKRGYFLDWRICDLLKKTVLPSSNFVLDMNDYDNPRVVSKDLYLSALEQVINRPFSLVPFFDPGPWGGQWMKSKFHLDADEVNYAWCFNCVPEENSLLLDFEGILFETPAINLVFFKTNDLLGDRVEKRFGSEFPIRFDFLDTIGGGNLSLQVHPLESYIKENFGMPYTQDESYYIMDSEENAKVYLGLNDNIDSDQMINDLKKSQENGAIFDADKYVHSWPAKKHDHFIIPSGTVHCSGAGCMVLEVSATPYIFTFKLWDWNRLGMDGKPRPINVDRGKKVIQWNRTTEWTEQNLINNIQVVTKTESYTEEITGLNPEQFIETRRYHQKSKVSHSTNGSVNVLMIVEGERAIIESPEGHFKPFYVNYAEAFIIPAKIDTYTIKPLGTNQITIIKAFIRENQ